MLRGDGDAGTRTIRSRLSAPRSPYRRARGLGLSWNNEGGRRGQLLVASGKGDGMTQSSPEIEIASDAEPTAEMPLPTDPKTIFLGGLFTLALLATAYVASEIVLPLVFAFTLKLLLQPFQRILERWRVPRALAALLLILALFGTIVGLGAAISGPASQWAAKLPEGLPRL